MAYKWKPSKSQAREFANNMKNDSDFRDAYYARREARAEVRRSTSQFDYASAGGNYIPTLMQYEVAVKMKGFDLLPVQDDAANQVMSGWLCQERIHHDYIHIINEFQRASGL